MAQRKKDQKGQLSAVRSNELLGCPFCGEKAIAIQRRNKLWDIGCENELCFGWCCHDAQCNCSDGYTLLEDAKKRWNLRAT